MNIKNVMAREHVATQLLAQGYEVSSPTKVTMPSGAMIEVIKVTLPGGTVIDVAVRSRWTGYGEEWWVTDDEVESAREDLFFVYVDVTVDEPQIWVVPSLVVAKAVMAREVAWLADDPKRNGTPHRKVFSASNRETWNVPGYPAGWANHYRDAWVTMDLVEHAAK